jgi:hypothetical protein
VFITVRLTNLTEDALAVGVTTTVETMLHQAVFTDVGTLYASGVYTDRTFTWDTSWAANDIYAIHAVGAASMSITKYSPKAPTRIVVNNVPPTVEVGPNQLADVGQVLNFSGTFTDPGLSDTHAIWWDFGDGTISNGALTVTHSYGAGGVYTATLTVIDSDGDVGSAAVRVEVSPTGSKIYLPLVVREH